MIRLIDERIMEMLRDTTEEVDLEKLVPLVVEWRAERALKAKCPYCVEPIQKQATKCSRCSSEIEWFKFDGLYGPCKAGTSNEMEAVILMAKAVIDAARAEKKAEFAARVSMFKKTKCHACGKLVFPTDKLDEIFESGDEKELDELDEIFESGDESQSAVKTYRCCDCIEKKEKYHLLAFLVIVIVAITLFLILG